MILNVPAQEFEQKKDQILWLMIAQDTIRNFEDDIRAVLSERTT